MYYYYTFMYNINFKFITSTTYEIVYYAYSPSCTWPLVNKKEIYRYMIKFNLRISNNNIIQF